MKQDPYINQILSNRYRLTTLIGNGAMGKVYRADDLLLGGVVAVKVLSHTLNSSTKFTERFKAEAKICSQLGQKSNNIVKVTDFGIKDDTPFYVMEYLQGKNLSEVIITESISLRRFVNLTRQICLGLQQAHIGVTNNNQQCPVIHKDIKPGNIFIIQDDLLGEMVKILDFGVAEMVQSNANQTSTFMGTFAYCSPEQMEGKPLNSLSDIYSLGILMYEMLTGKPAIKVSENNFGAWYEAHHDQIPRELNCKFKLPKALRTLVIECLAKKIDDRPSIDKILKTIGELGKGTPAQSAKVQVPAEVKILKTLPKSDTSNLIEKIFNSAVWPDDKPCSRITFPSIYSTEEERVPAVYVMISEDEVRSLQTNRLYNQIYKNSLRVMSPHPMGLLLTGFINGKHNWLPVYLDLKSKFAQEFIQLIIEKKQYKVLLFTLENPKNCSHVINIILNQAQVDVLKQWLIEAHVVKPVGNVASSKQLLKAEFEKIKSSLMIE